MSKLVTVQNYGENVVTLRAAKNKGNVVIPASRKVEKGVAPGVAEIEESFLIALKNDPVVSALFNSQQLRKVVPTKGKTEEDAKE